MLLIHPSLIMINMIEAICIFILLQAVSAPLGIPCISSCLSETSFDILSVFQKFVR